MIFSYEDEDAVKGIEYFYIGDFFGYFFIRKCMWSTPSTIKTTAASIKKFYKFMYETNRVKKEEYEDFAKNLNESLDGWCEDCRIFNDGKEYIDFWSFNIQRFEVSDAPDDRNWYASDMFLVIF